MSVRTRTKTTGPSSAAPWTASLSTTTWNTTGCLMSTLTVSDQTKLLVFGVKWFLHLQRTWLGKALSRFWELGWFWQSLSVYGFARFLMPSVWFNVLLFWLVLPFRFTTNCSNSEPAQIPLIFKWLITWETIVIWLIPGDNCSICLLKSVTEG